MLEIPEVLESETASTTTNTLAPVPKPRKRPPKAVPRVRPRSLEDPRSERERVEAELGIEPITFQLGNTYEKPDSFEIEEVFTETPLTVDDIEFLAPISEEPVNFKPQPSKSDEYSMEEILSSLEMVKPFIMRSTESLSTPPPVLIGSLQRTTVTNIFNSDEFLKEPKPPEVVGVIRKSLVRDSKTKNKKQIDDCLSEKVAFPDSSTSGMLIFFFYLCLSVIRRLSLSSSTRVVVGVGTVQS